MLLSTPSSRCFSIIFWIISKRHEAGAANVPGPIFVYEPPTEVHFMNRIGTVVDCSAYGDPLPTITWLTKDDDRVRDVEGVRKIHSNGSMTFSPFQADEYNHNHHSASYRCEAANRYGRVVSRTVNVEGDVERSFRTAVYDDYVIEGNTGVLKCNVPNYVVDDVTVVGWRRGDNILVTPHRDSDHGNKYEMFPNGFLHVKNADAKIDANTQFWCETRHKLSGRIQLSSVGGKLSVSGHSSLIPPKITHYEKELIIGPDDNYPILVPCAAQGSPIPEYRWFIGKSISMVNQVPQHDVRKGTLILRKKLRPGDYRYTCAVKNKVGVGRKTTTVIVRESLSAFIEPMLQTRDVGDGVTMNCSVRGHPVESIVWLHNGRRIESGENIRVEAKKFRSDLRIKSLSTNLAGMYQCVVRNLWEEQQAIAQIMLGDSPPVFRHKFGEKILQAGPSLSLKCSAKSQPRPHISWYMDGEIIRTSSRKININSHLTSDGDVIGHLNITSIGVKDGGDYMCVAGNNVGNISHYSRVNVYGQPSVRPMKNYTEIAGTNLTLKCPYYGYPVDTVTWTKESDGTGSEVYSKAAELRLVNISRFRHQGKYTCRVTSKSGLSSNRSTWIRTINKPLLGEMYNDSANAGQQVSILCSIRDGTKPITIAWLKNDLKIPIQTGIEITNTKAFSAIQIDRSTHAHSGRYTCIATNLAGRVNSSMSLTIYSPPSFARRPVDQTAKKYSEVIFKCSVVGHPKPKVSWSRLMSGVWVPVMKDDNHRVKDDGSLKIERALRLQKYKCSATNGYKPDLRAIVSLTVGEPAVIEKFPRSFEKLTEDELEIECNVNGTKPLSVTWRKIDTSGLALVKKPNYRWNIIEKKYRKGVRLVLKISRLTKEDSGRYVCSASNIMAVDSKYFQLAVKNRLPRMDVTSELPATNKTVISKEKVVFVDVRILDEEVVNDTEDETVNEIRDIGISGRENVRSDREDIPSVELFEKDALLFLVPAGTVIFFLLLILTVSIVLLVKRNRQSPIPGKPSFGDSGSNGKSRPIRSVPSAIKSEECRRPDVESPRSPMTAPYQHNYFQDNLASGEYYSELSPYGTITVTGQQKRRESISQQNQQVSPNATL